MCCVCMHEYWMLAGMCSNSPLCVQQLSPLCAATLPFVCSNSPLCVQQLSPLCAATLPFVCSNSPLCVQQLSPLCAATLPFVCSNSPLCVQQLSPLCAATLPFVCSNSPLCVQQLSPLCAATLPFVCSNSPLCVQQLSPLCAEQVLQDHLQDQFLKEMNTAAIVHEEDHDIISSPDTMKIRESRVWTELNEAHFKQTCSKAMRGHPKEGALDADMKSMLEGKCCLCLCVRACVCAGWCYLRTPHTLYPSNSAQHVPNYLDSSLLHRTCLPK